LRRAYADAAHEPTRVHEVTLAVDATARPTAVLDVVLATATVRMCLVAEAAIEACCPLGRLAA